jgi:hypothetical protein
MRLHYRLIVFSTLLLVPILDISAQILRGHITNAKGEPLPYATIYIAETRMGTATNLDGKFELTLPAGTYSVTFQCLGYKPVNETIVIENRTIEKNIILSEQIFDMPEVHVYATGKDRAYYIMRKTIGMAPYHLNQVKLYKAEVYIKGGGIIEKIPRILKKQMQTEANDVQIEEGKYYFSESVNIITFTSPDKYVQQVLSSKSNSPMGEEGGASPMDFIQASFYQPVLIDVAISPLAPNAFSHYNFKFLGATKQGDSYIDKIQVTPKRKSQQLFSGVLFIVDEKWAIQSLELTNENMLGTISVKQLYMPVEKDLWMPVSHDFSIKLSIMGIKANASYTSSVKYLEVEPDKSLPVPVEYAVTDESTVKEAEMSKEEKEIEAILAKEKISASDMVRLSKINQKATKPKEKPPLEVKDNTTYIIDEDATKKDSAYWEEIRPIPLTEIEKMSVAVAAKTDTMVARTNNTLTVSIGIQNKPDDNKKHKVAAVTKAVISGKNWNISKKSSLDFDGLVSLKTFSFNTVDGFTAGTGLTYFGNKSEKLKFTINPVVRYAFNRKDLMWALNSNISFNPMKQSSLSLIAGSLSKDFSFNGINPFINTISSLAFRYNWIKLYKSSFVSLAYKSEISNGLNISITGSWENRQTLDNSTDYSIFKPNREYTPNIPDNPFVQGKVKGYDAIFPVNHFNISFTGEITYTPRQRYRIKNGAKINLPPDNPTFNLSWKHGYNYNDTLSGNYDLLKGDISMHHEMGAMRQFRWHLTGGGFINRNNVQLQDMYFFNTQSSPVLINNYEDALYLKETYAISSPSLFAGVNMKYTSPCLVLKRLPILSRTLMRENLSLSWLWTPNYGNYTEVGYSISEIFLLAEAGVFTGFRNTSFDSAGFRLIFRFE